MMTVVRVEHPSDGWGMFRATSWDKKSIVEEEIIDSMQHRHYRFRTPYLEGLNMSLYDREWFCAYKSMDQIVQWIYPEDFKALISLGFIIYLLDVTEYQEGRDQVVFTKESIINKKDISSIFL